MARYECSVCGYTYDEAEEGRAWGDLPASWTCPRCGAAKAAFRLAEAAEGPAAAFPPAVLTAHRVFGYAFLALYLFMVWEMAPRLWSYQIEFPARTVLHLALGMAIGPLLVLKILIVRFFRRLDAALVPALGTSLFVGTAVLIGISAPFAFHEAVIRQASAAEGLFAPNGLQRVRTLLVEAGLGEAEAAALATPESLQAGQQVLRGRCTECHDLRTVLARPRTPENWLQTVKRMADRTTALDAINQQQQRQVTAYLVAISPDLQRSAQQMRTQKELGDQTRQAIEAVAEQRLAPSEFDLQQARLLFESTCSKCHSPSFVEAAPPASADEARQLVARMVEEGLTAGEEELSQIVRYLTATYAEGATEEADR